ncbi:MAG: hypothetical protein JWL81_2672, partial [Verrucomicrobiales bacterium]|nr:hypothetical protein [Verrucomicrobiales bacterium]
MNSLLRDIRTLGLRAALLGGTTLRDVGRLEGFFLRLLFAIVVWRSLEYYPDYATALKPVGLAAWPALWQTLGWEITRLADPVFWAQILVWVKIALIFYTFGIGLPLALPFLAIVHIAIRTLNNSQGAAHHGFQMVSLALLTQTAVVWFLASARLFQLLKKRPFPRWAAPGNWTWLWVYTIAIAAASYIISVCSKIDESKGQWLKNSPYVATQIVKTHRQNYYNSLDTQFIQGVLPATPPDADPATDRYRHPIPPSADWLGRHPDFARILFSAGFFLELFVFLAVLDRRAALLFGLGLVSLHGSIAWLMELSFPFNERTVGVFFVNAAGWLILMIHEPAWRPGKKIWLFSFLAAAALLAGRFATNGSESTVAHFLDLAHHPAAILPGLFNWPAAVNWT